MLTLSLAMIVRNEAEWLEPCLESVRGLVDEMVLLDTGSTDGTPDLARRLGARVHSFEWCDDFSAARNASLGHCGGDWVLVLDADEELDADAHDRVRACLAQDATWAFRVILRNYFSTGLFTNLDQAPQPRTSTHGRAATFSHQVDFPGLRLFRRLPWAQYEGRIHELVDGAFERRGLAILPTGILVHHFGKTLSDREAAKRSLYLEMARIDAREHPDRAQAQFNLLQQAMNAHDWPTTLEAALAYQALAAEGPPLVLYAGAVALQSLGRNAEALAWFDRLLGARPDHAAGLVRKGVSLAALGRTDEAHAAFEAATGAAPSYALAYLNHSELAQAQGRPELAREILARGLQAQPGDTALWEALVRLGLTQQDIPTAVLDAWKALRAAPSGGGGLWQRLVALSLLEQGREGLAREIVAQGLRVHPGDPDLGALGQRLA
jgi:glycosyltransferase involved in cell wall biosynthesis